ncbi:hypothetical protein [uncultured Aureimonas sp.]|uniref:hypothetical protein n=1 Tax=uncultured Aureimonas sp. TaxID=1604662 RepID=UPI0025E3BBD9|nr:hypothetical protein [uncultured Aureimonas sp.]
MAIAPTPSQGWSSFFSQTYASRPPAGTATASGAALAIPVQSGLDFMTFGTWTPDSQRLYILANGTGTPPMIDLPGKNWQGSVFRYAVRAAGNGVESLERLDGEYDDAWRSVTSGTVDKMPNRTALTAETFRTWTAQHQSAYLTVVAGAQDTLTLPGAGGTATAFTLNGGSGVLSVAVAATGLEPTPGMEFGETRTPGGEQKIPYYHLPGTASGGDGAIVKAGADALFPDLDGTSAAKRLAGPKPDGFTTLASSFNEDSTPTDAERTAIRNATASFLLKFKDWHSSHQMEWFVANAGGLQVMEKPLFTSGSDALKPLLSLFKTSETPPRLLNLANLSKEEFGFLPSADQKLVAGTAMFANLSTKIGLAAIAYDSDRAIDTTTGGGVIVKEIDDLITKVRNGLPDADEGVFVDQLAILRSRVSASGAVDVTGLRAQISDISKRYERAENYHYYGDGNGGETTRKITIDGGVEVSIPSRINSMDGGALIKQGYRTMIAQEKLIADNMKEREAVANGTVTMMNGKNFDAATLIYFFQNKYNLDLEAVVTIETEAVKQLNAYLKDYALWQDQVNSTTSTAFSKDDIDKGNKKGLNGWTHELLTAYRADPNSERGKLFKLALMFEDSNGYWQHPAEDEKGADFKRPDNFDIFISYDAPSNDSEKNTNFDVTTHTQGEWNTYATRLGDKVTQLNQDSQQRMNDINNKDKQRNRHYDLANSALSKMNDALQSILRASGG